MVGSFRQVVLALKPRDAAFANIITYPLPLAQRFYKFYKLSCFQQENRAKFGRNRKNRRNTLPALPVFSSRGRFCDPPA